MVVFICLSLILHRNAAAKYIFLIGHIQDFYFVFILVMFKRVNTGTVGNLNILEMRVK